MAILLMLYNRNNSPISISTILIKYVDGVPNDGVMNKEETCVSCGEDIC